MDTANDRVILGAGIAAGVITTLRELLAPTVDPMRVGRAVAGATAATLLLLVLAQVGLGPIARGLALIMLAVIVLQDAVRLLRQIQEI